MTSSAYQLPPLPPREGHVPVEELARRQGVQPITSVDDLAVPGLFDDDIEHEEFLADLYASRQASIG